MTLLRLDVLARNDAHFDRGNSTGQPFVDYIRDLQREGGVEPPHTGAPGTAPPAPPAATPGTSLPEQAPPTLPRLPPLSAAGVVITAAKVLDRWDQRRGERAVSEAMTRFGLDPSKPADVAAAQAYVRAGWIVPNKVWSVPYSGPAHDRVAEAVMRAERDDPGLFDRAFGDPPDPAARKKLDGVIGDAMADVGGAAGKPPPGGTGNVREDGECDEKANVGPSSPKSRLPVNNGNWTGDPGNSGWQPTRPEAVAATGGKPIPYVNGRPDFTQWAKPSVNLPAGSLTGHFDKDLIIVQKYLARTGRPEFQSMKALERYMGEKRLIMHHATDTCVQFIPVAINEVPHVGSAADIRHQRRLSWTPSTQ